MGEGNGSQGKPVLRSYRFPLSELTNAHTCAELKGGLTYLGQLVEKQNWEGGSLEVVVEVIQPKGEDAYLEVTQRIEEEQLLLPLGGDKADEPAGELAQVGHDADLGTEEERV